jgi:hypothetical protein
MKIMCITKPQLLNPALHKAFLVLLLAFTLLCGRVANMHGAESDGLRMIRTLHIPVVRNYGYVDIFEVPVTLHGEPLNNFAEAMCAPVFAGSGLEEDYKNDINLISLSKIKIKFENVDAKAPFDTGSDVRMIIDVSHFIPPKGCEIDIYDLIQMILTCIRLEFPPGQLNKVTISIAGAKESMGLSTLEGLLWKTGRRK